MTISNVQPVFPNGIFPWVDKVDQQDIDFAEDVNSIAAEVESVENTIGTTPQVESNPPTGNPVTYSTVSARISDAMDNAQLPYVSLSSSSFTCPNNSAGNFIPYQVHLDPFNCYNGTDIACPANGWWFVSTVQTWNWWNDGYSHHMLCLNGFGNILHEDFVNWEFPGNLYPGGLSQPVQLITPRWWQFGKRNIRTQVMWQGALHKGDRLSVLAENGTSNAQHVINGLTLKASMLRTISGNFVSG
jgi:hypothetical protein